MPTYAFIGLGNPGSKYAATRHNYGYMALASLMQAFGASNPKEKFNGQLAEAIYQQHKIYFFTSQQYMNLSGHSAAALVSFYNIPLSQVIVLHDELDIPLGEVRTKVGGGHAGHNGLKSMDGCIGNAYVRLRLGIGRPEVGDVAHYVLSDFLPAQNTVVQQVLDNIAKNYAQLLAPTPALAKMLSMPSGGEK